MLKKETNGRRMERNNLLSNFQLIFVLHYALFIEIEQHKRWQEGNEKNLLLTFVTPDTLSIIIVDITIRIRIGFHQIPDFFKLHFVKIHFIRLVF